jgi:hypothetical protein
MLAGDGVTRAAESDEHRNAAAQAIAENVREQFAPKAKSVIWFFMLGGTSHLESFDPKPAIDKYSGLTIDESPFRSSVLDSPYYRKNVRDFAGTPRALMAQLYPTQIGFRRRGQSGIEVSDWWPHVGDCIDDIAVVRSMWTTDNDHAAEFQMHTGRHKLDAPEPVIGSWLNYGLGTLNENLPKFVFLGEFKDPRVKENFDAHYLGPTYGGVQLHLDPSNPLAFGKRAADVSAIEQRGEFEFLQQLHLLATLYSLLQFWLVLKGILLNLWYPLHLDLH